MTTTKIIIGEHQYVGIPASKHAKDLADLFANLDSNEQAEFFNQVARRVSEWKNDPGMQWLYVGDKMSPDAKRLIDDLADHIK